MLDSTGVTGAGARHLRARQLREPGHHGVLQGVQSVMGGPVDVPIAVAQHVVVKGVAVRAAGGHTSLPQKSP